MTTLSRSTTWAAAIAVAAILGGCAAPGHGMHGMHGSGAGMACPMHAEMHQKMAAAKTPEERQAMMAEHHKGMGAAGGIQCPMMQPSAK